MLRSMEGDYRSGKSFITSPLTVLQLLGNYYDVTYGVYIMKRIQGFDRAFLPKNPYNHVICRLTYIFLKVASDK